MLEFDFSSHGAGMIHAYRWEPEGQPRGVVQILSLIHISEPTRH